MSNNEMEMDVDGGESPLLDLPPLAVAAVAAGLSVAPSSSSRSPTAWEAATPNRRLDLLLRLDLVLRREWRTVLLIGCTSRSRLGTRTRPGPPWRD